MLTSYALSPSDYNIYLAVFITGKRGAAKIPVGRIICRLPLPLRVAAPGSTGQFKQEGILWRRARLGLKCKYLSSNEATISGMMQYRAQCNNGTPGERCGIWRLNILPARGFRAVISKSQLMALASPLRHESSY